MPREDKGTGKTRGFGYAEFDDRDSLIDALKKHGESFNGRTLRVSLPDESGRDERRTGGFGGPGGSMGDEDRTLRDWRSGPKTDLAPASSGSWRSERSSSGFDSGYGGGPRVSSIRDGGFRNGYGSESRYDSYAPAPRQGRFGDDHRPGGFDRGSRGGYDSFDRYDDRRGDRGDRGGDREIEFSRDIMRPLPPPSNRGAFPPREDLPPRPQGNDDYDRRDRDRERDDHVVERRPLQRQHSGQTSERTRSDSDNSGSGHQPREQRNISPPPSEGPRQRPKLNLQKRTVPLEEVAAPAPVRSSIFGDAKPVDTTRREKEIEEKLKTLEVTDETSSSTKDEKEGTVSSSGGRTRKISSSSSHSHSARSRKESETDSRHEDHNFSESGFHSKPRGPRPFDSNRRGGPSSHLPSGPRGGDRRPERRNDDREHYGRRDDHRDNRRPLGDHRSGPGDHRRRDVGDRERPHRVQSDRPPRESNNSRNENRKDPVSIILSFLR